MRCRQKRGFMQKKGILFQGLPQTGGKGYKDITYLFLYGLSRNILCRAKTAGMRKEWREYLLEKAEKSAYQSPAFWKMLKKEERRCARVALGLLEDFRNGRDVRAEKAWVCLYYLVRSGYRREEEYLRENRKISFTSLWNMEKLESEETLLRTSRICMCLLIAEEKGGKVIPDENTYEFAKLLKKVDSMWAAGGSQESADMAAKTKRESMNLSLPFFIGSCIVKLVEVYEKKEMPYEKVYVRNMKSTTEKSQ